MSNKICELRLSYFRNYAEFNLVVPTDSDGIFIYGDNGSGKTNILEAVSLLVPGRGLRGSSLSEYPNNKEKKSWVVFSKIQTKLGLVELGTGINSLDDTKRTFFLNGSKPKKQNLISDILQFVMFSPQMDGLFLSSAGNRRHFLDRLIVTFDNAHLGRLNSYEKAVRERNKILSSEVNNTWLDAVENTIVERGVAISASRMLFLEQLQSHSMKRRSVFPKILLFQDCKIEKWLNEMPSIEVEELYRKTLKENRKKDSILQSTTIGCHRSDFIAVLEKNNMVASNCSTGEQKMIMMALLLSYSDLLTYKYKNPPIFLLDEIFTHLDNNHQDSLINELLEFKSQIWITGVDNKQVIPYSSKIHMFNIK